MQTPDSISLLTEPPVRSSGEARAAQLRPELLERSQEAARANQPRVESALHPLLTDGPLLSEELMTAPLPAALRDAAGRAARSVNVSPAELARLQRLVQLATSAITELNLWLVTVGQPLDPEDR